MSECVKTRLAVCRCKSCHEKRQDSERLDWLSSLSTFDYDEHKNPYVGHPDFDKVDKRTLFTIPSQHVDGENLRDAIDRAMSKAQTAR